MTINNGTNETKGVNSTSTANGVNGVNRTSTVNGANGSNGYTEHAAQVNGHHEPNTNGDSGTCPKLEGYHEGDSAPQFEPIAIVGMAMRLPGGVHDAESYWDLLVNKRSGQCRVPKDRYNIDAWYGPGKIGHVASKDGYFLEELDLGNTDTSFWTMTKQEVEAMDPQQRLMLEVVYECLQNAGAKNWRGKNIGCYLGTFEGDWLDLDGKDSQNAHIYRLTGYGDYMAANRVSYEFGLKGPSVTIRTACSSSLTGLHDACYALMSGECTSAIVGAANLIFSPRTTVTMQEQGVMSPTGSCKSFDASADGYARGEAVTALYVKKLSDAIRDGDTVRAVIRATCINSGGKSASLTTPNAESHEYLIRRGHQLAGISDFSKTAMIECHGTGTKVGDPVEASAVANVFGEYGIYIGSVKTNLGHSEGASGLSSLIKMVLALEHKTIPPNIHFKTPNPRIPFEKAKLKVPVEPMAWPAGRMERVGVNCFGIGGSNAHILLESAASFNLNKHDAISSGDGAVSRLLVFSAKHPESLRRTIENHESYLSAHPDSLQDMAHSLGTRREQLPLRSFCVTTGEDAFEMSKVTKPGSGACPKLVFTFTGQGAQWAQMAKDLIDEHPLFRKTIQELDGVLYKLPDRPQWSLESEILKSKKQSRLSEAELSQPCCTAIQIALVDLLKTWNVQADAVVGHSSGEIGAAYACGSITAREGIIIAYYRGQVVRGLGKTRPGGMAAIGLGRDNVTEYLRPGVIIGCENSPSSVTLTGDKDILEAVMENIRSAQPDTLVRALRVDCAYHSHHMKAVEAEYRSLLGKKVHATTPKIPFYSSVTGEIIKEGGDLGASYWIQNLVSPVLFSSAVDTILTGVSTQKIFLEIGPHSALAGPIRQILRESKVGPQLGAEYIPTLIRSGNGRVDLLKSAGELWLNNVDLDFDSINGPGKYLTDLPPYPWNYDSPYWVESRLSKEWRLRKFPHHDILGSRVLESTDFDPSWRNMLSLDSVRWIQDHEVAGNILFPGVGYICMAAEAIRQLTEATDWTVRRVTFNAAMVLHQGQATEVITHLRPARLTTTLDSVWWDFTVSSLNGSNWIKHSFGQIRAGSEYDTPAPEIKALSRNVSSNTWYRVLRKFGFDYGPSFLGMSDMSADPTDEVAVATISQDLKEGESYYSLHPATLDCTIQLFSAAAYHGLPRLYQHLSIPSYIGELYVKPPKGKITMQALIHTTPEGTKSDDLIGVSEGETVITMKGLRLSRIGDSDDVSGEDPHAAVELEFKNDVNFLDASQLIRPLKDRTDVHRLLDEFSLACMIETCTSLQGAESTQPYLRKFHTWLENQLEEAASGGYPNVSDSATLHAMGSSKRMELIEALYKQCKETEAAATATAIYRIYTSCKDIFTGATDPLDLLLGDGVLNDLYDFMQNSEYSEFLDLVAHYKPNLKILEIGAGTGGTTSTVLPHLKSTYGERMYLSYTYTDISSGFFISARERFKECPAIEYSILDISKDPIEQGFEAESFDLIIACNVLHATPKLDETMKHVRKLLHPGGRLFLQELSPMTKWINFVFGVLPGWWLGEADGRISEPYISAQNWDKVLKSTGFSGVNAISYDGYLNNNIVAMPALSEGKPKRLTVLRGATSPAGMTEVEDSLRKKGYELDFCTLYETPTPRQDIVSLLDLEAPYLHSTNAEQFDAFVKFLARIEDSGVLWVTGACQLECKDPRYALIMGMARNIRVELGMDFATLELEAFDENGWKAVSEVLEGFHNRLHDPEMNPTLEWAYADGRIQVSRYHWISVSKQLLDNPRQSCPRTLEIPKPGFINSLAWKQVEALEVTGDQIEVDIRAVGLNFRDIMISMGLIEGQKALGRGLGYESCGIVRRVGPDAKTLKVGDRVVCCSSGSFTTLLTLTESLCAKIPDQLNFSDAVTMPAVYCTVIHSFVDVARMQKGQSVLIHSACGGVGLAAIQLAHMIGAEIYCTVGTPEKVDYLVDNFGIPRNRIFNSRDSTFLPDVLRETSGRGVDIVLNSLSGELLQASWKCVAQFGIMVEIGKRDFVGQGSLPMDLFEANRSFVGVDLQQISAERPLVINSLLRRALEWYEKGFIKPITVVKDFPATHAGDAFRYMQKGQHIGKIIVTMPENAEDLDSVTGRKDLLLRPDMAYLSVGGLGGLGRSVATWLVEKGAKHLVFFSRSAGNLPKDDSYILELEAQGCTVQAISGDVTNFEDVQSMIKSIGKPVGGVLQASMVLKDAPLIEMTNEQWQAAVAPKVQGTWNLHNALLAQDTPLDFFFLFSSGSGIQGQWGQANYACANTFLNAFVQYRQSQNLPASTIDIGVVEEIGYLSRNRDILEALRATSIHILHEQDLLDSLQLMIHRSYSQPSVSASASASRSYVNPGQIGLGLRSTLPMSAPNNRTVWRRDPRMSVYRNLEVHDLATGASNTNESLKQFLRDASSNPTSLGSEASIAFLASEIGKTLSGFMMMSDEAMDLTTSLAALGVDSLISIELRNWFRQKVGVEFTVLELVGATSIMQLGELAGKKVMEKYQARA